METLEVLYLTPLSKNMTTQKLKIQYIALRAANFDLITGTTYNSLTSTRDHIWVQSQKA